MYIRVVSNRNCSFHRMGESHLTEVGNRPSSFVRGKVGNDYAHGREYWAELKSLIPLHPGREFHLFQCDQVHGLTNGIDLAISVFSQDQSLVVADLQISRNIGQQIEADKGAHSQVIIRIEPQAFLAAD